MFRFLLLLLLLIPVIEIWGFVIVGKEIGGFNTVLLVILTGLLGGYFAKNQGLRVLQEAQWEINQGRIPGKSILNGISVLIGGILLILPGFLTDLLGLIFLLPFTRHIFVSWFIVWLEKRIRKGNFHITYLRRK